MLKFPQPVSCIPNELLLEIFTLLLPFDVMQISRGEIPPVCVDFRLVCSLWATVGASVAYRILVLRPRKGKIAHLKGILSTLKAYGVGGTVRAIHIEGGCGAIVRDILRLATQIQIVSVDLRLEPTHSVGGLCDAIRKFANTAYAPATLVIHDEPYNGGTYLSARRRASKPRRLVLEALVKVLPHWQTLETLRLPYESRSVRSQSGDILKASKQLKCIIVDDVLVVEEIVAVLPPQLERIDIIHPPHNAVLARFQDKAWIGLVGLEAQVATADRIHACVEACCQQETLREMQQGKQDRAVDSKDEVRVQEVT
ncbi:hypothetical protein C8F01DRAFT_1076012 [Mycena amicta]|nr:hypothetical protein C8F01DRAFT_1076012 [Mycena amicta]